MRWWQLPDGSGSGDYMMVAAVAAARQRQRWRLRRRRNDGSDGDCVMAPPAATTARWQQQRDCGSGGSGGGNCRMATEVMAAVTQWRRQAHNITIKYAAAGSKRQRWQQRRQQLQR
jgi:hypothetical protein